MNKNTMIGIAVVVVVVVVAIAAAVTLTGNNNKEIPDTAGSYGLVYGNADGNAVINGTDIDVINHLIDNPEDQEKYPFADANRDGTIDSDDVALVQKIIDKESCTVYAQDVNNDVVSISYPLESLFVSGGTNMRVIVSVLDLQTIMVANATNDYIDPTLDKSLYDLRENGTIIAVTTSATDADFTTLSGLKFSAALIEGTGMTGYLSDNARSNFAAYGSSVMGFSVDGYDSCLQAVATIGILVCQSEKAVDYIDYCESVHDTIKEKLGDDYGTKTVMTVVMTNSVSGTSSDYFAASELAGGDNIAKFENKTEKFNEGGTWLFSYNPEYLIHTKSMSYESQPSTTDINNVTKYFSETAAYKDGNYYLINGLLPLPVRMAYMAEIMYPESFENGWAESVHQEYLDDYAQIDWTASEHKYIWSVKDLLSA